MLSASSSVLTLMRSVSLKASRVFWPKVSELSGIAPFSGTQVAVDSVAATAILRSAEEEKVLAMLLTTFASCRFLTSWRSNSTGTR